MTFKETMANLFSASEGAYYKWKREKRPIIQLVDKYLSKEDIEEFLETGEIKKFENIKFITDNYVAKSQAYYINSFKESQSSLSEPHVLDRFKDFYFNFLSDFGKINFPFNINALGIQSLLIHYLYQYQTREIKKSLDTNNINQELKDYKIKINEALNSSKGKEKKELEKFKEDFQEVSQKEKIMENIFSKKENEFESIMLHFFTFNSWNNDMYYFLELIKKDEFDYFINSKNDELLYQAIGYLVYSLSHNLNMEEKLQIISSIFHYFIFNRDLISSSNIKEHLFKRLENPESFSKIDEEISHKYITSHFPENNTNDLNSKEIIEVEEEISIEDFFKKYQNK